MANTTASGTILFDLLDVAELTQYARAFYDEVARNPFTLRSYLPERQINRLNWEAPRGGRQDVEVAEYRPWDVPAPMTGRQGVAKVRGELAPMSRAIPLGEEEGLRLNDIAAAGGQDPRIAQAYNDVELMLRAIAGRVELARADVLIDGVLNLDDLDNGVDGLSVDYEVPSENFATAAAAWTVANAATATPITDLRGLAEVLIANGYDLSNYDLIMSKTRFPALQVNEEVLEYARGTAIAAPARVNEGTVRAILADEGLPNIVFYDTFVRRGPGAPQVRVLPTDHAILVPRPGAGEDPFGETLFGPTAEAQLLVERRVIAAQDAPGIVALVLQSEHPVQKTTLAAATALPTLVNPEAVAGLDLGS